MAAPATARAINAIHHRAVPLAGRRAKRAWPAVSSSTITEEKLGSGPVSGIAALLSMVAGARLSTTRGDSSSRCGAVVTRL
jgi:hypothetical protein